MTKKKILFIINYFYPDFASTGQLMTELCQELQYDYEITVIAAQPGYAGEKILNRKKIEREQFENINIIRVNLPSVNKTKKLSRLNYIFNYFILATISMIKEKKIDLIYTISQPPILGGLIGTIGKFIKRTKHIYNIQDFNPEQAEAVKYTNRKAIYRIAKHIDKINCSYSDKLILVGNDMVETLKDRFENNRIPSNVVINNWTDEEKIIPLNKNHPEVQSFLKKHSLENKFIIMYSGNLGLFYDLENIIKITLDFREVEDLAFVFIGEGAVKEEMQKFTSENKINNVHFLPYQLKDYIKYSLNAADIHLVVNQKGIKGVSVPSKIYGVLAAGKPILGVLEDGSEAHQIIKKSQCGILVEPQDYRGIKESIEKFYKMDRERLVEIGHNGREYLEENLTKKISIKKYKEVLNEIIM